MRVRLTPGQSCYLHGWMTPKPTLCWGDVVATPSMTLQNLTSAGISPATLHQLQPDASKWVKAGRVTLTDCPSMVELWEAHPVRDFEADLGDILGQKWTAETMQTMGLTYMDMVLLGLTPASMSMFTNVTLRGWALLGMSRADVARTPEAVLSRLFDGMTKQDIMRSLK
jgi:hypothetical protein